MSFKYYILSLLFLVSASTSIAQNFNTFYDIDSTGDWGYDIFQDSGKFTVIGTAASPGQRLFAIKVSSAGDHIQLTGTAILKNAWCNTGLAGRIKVLPDGNFLTPFSVHWASANLESVSAGYAILDRNGNMLSYHIYNLDTANYQQEVFDVIQLPDKGFLLAGNSTRKANNFKIGQLIRTDSAGNQIWIKAYSYLGYQEITTSVDLLDNNILLIGSSVKEVKVIKKNDPIYYYHPRFMKIDLDGNILRDTIYMQGFAGRGTMGGGNIFKDRNGGFFHYGQLEQILDSTYIDNVINFPDYVAHLDDDFRITWMKVFNDSPGHKYIWMVRQLKDNGYLAFSGSKRNNLSNARGWGVRLDNTGNIVWDNSYAYDTAGWQCFTDAYELADKSIVFTGMEINFKQPSWHQGDVWLLKVDSNGCEQPGCAPTAIDPAQVIKTNSISIYPNPVYNELYIEGLQERTRMLLYDVYGREVYNSVVMHTKETIPTATLPPGNYILQLTDPDGKRSSYKVLKQ
jgi:hypothetical protein